MPFVVIDDEPGILKVLNSWGKLYGIPLRCFGDVRDALSAITRETKVVLTDWRMPHGGGLHVFETIKVHHPHITCGVMSADLPEHRDAAFFIRKPFTIDTLNRELIPHLLRR